MSGLFGTYEKVIDSKGRVVVPNEFRSRIDGNDWVLTKWVEGNLALFAESRWNALAERIHLLGIETPEIRAARRLLLASAYPVQPDAQGRLIIPTPLRSFAQIDQEVILVGDWDKVQIWDKAHFMRTERSEMEKDASYTKAVSKAYQILITPDDPVLIEQLKGTRSGENGGAVA